MKHNPWFRMYSEAIDDDKLRLLAFEDRWHFVALLCCKCKGILDEAVAPEMLWRRVAVRLGVQLSELEKIARRLAEVGLIDETSLQPIAWGDRQFKSDSSSERVRAYRERMKQPCNVTVTAQETETDTDTDNTKTKKGDTKRKRFTPPTIAEVKAFIAEKNLTLDAEAFVYHYQAVDWKVGRNKMSDWKAAARRWSANNKPANQQHISAGGI